MRVNGLEKLEEFWRRHSDARAPLDTWVEILRNNAYQDIARLQATFSSADYDKPHTIFNIGGNKYRLVAVLDYHIQVVVVHRVMTHAEYDKWNKKRNRGTSRC